MLHRYWSKKTAVLGSLVPFVAALFETSPCWNLSQRKLLDGSPDVTAVYFPSKSCESSVSFQRSNLDCHLARNSCISGSSPFHVASFVNLSPQHHQGCLSYHLQYGMLTCRNQVILDVSKANQAMHHEWSEANAQFFPSNRHNAIGNTFWNNCISAKSMIKSTNFHSQLHIKICFMGIWCIWYPLDHHSRTGWWFHPVKTTQVQSPRNPRGVHPGWQRRARYPPYQGVRKIWCLLNHTKRFY